MRYAQLRYFIDLGLKLACIHWLHRNMRSAALKAAQLFLIRVDGMPTAAAVCPLDPDSLVGCCNAYWAHIGLKSHLDLLVPGWHPFAGAPTTMEWADPLS